MRAELILAACTACNTICATRIRGNAYSEVKVAEHSFCGRSAVTRMTARVFNWTNKHGREKSNGTQKTISQNLLIKILRYLAVLLLSSYFK